MLFDGSSRGNPGSSGEVHREEYFVECSHSHLRMCRSLILFIPFDCRGVSLSLTRNQQFCIQLSVISDILTFFLKAEYRGLILGLKMAKSLRIKSLTCKVSGVYTI